MRALLEDSIAVWNNESAPGRCVNTNRGLTHSLDTTKEGLVMKTTRDDCIPYTGRPVRFQQKAADAYYVETGGAPGTWEWVTNSCGADCLNPDHMTFTAPIHIEYPANVCVYCGRSAWTKDHLLPRHWSGEAARAWVATVPACGTCNNVLNDTLTWSITERRSICHYRLRRHFKKVLNTVEFGPTDLAEFGPMLRDEVIKAMDDKEVVKAMLEWPVDPNYDERACQKSGIEDPYAIGFIITQWEADRIAGEVVADDKSRRAPYSDSLTRSMDTRDQ